MSIKKSQFEKDAFYFLTITCYKWLNLFEITKLYDHIYNWFDILKSSGIKTVSYVIMPNHLHAILFFSKNNQILSRTNNTKIVSRVPLKNEETLRDAEKSINQIIGTGKRFMAYEIVKRLKVNNEKNTLNILSDGVNDLECKRGKLHQVFQPSFDLKIIVTEKFLTQKINYIHTNPVSKKWNLVDDFREYKYSSAGFYELENFAGYKIYHYLEVL
jgi:putative transposase